MRQRIMIAMALSCRPRLIIADEPTTALDVTIQRQILELIKGIQDRTGTALLLITHDLGVVAETVDDVAVMYGGRVVETGTVEEVLLNPRHPYTRGLLESIPSTAKVGQRLSAIRGVVPNPFRMPAGLQVRAALQLRVGHVQRVGADVDRPGPRSRVALLAARRALRRASGAPTTLRRP